MVSSVGFISSNCNYLKSICLCFFHSQWKEVDISRERFILFEDDCLRQETWFNLWVPLSFHSLLGELIGFFTLTANSKIVEPFPATFWERNNVCFLMPVDSVCWNLYYWWISSIVASWGGCAAFLIQLPDAAGFVQLKETMSAQKYCNVLRVEHCTAKFIWSLRGCSCEKNGSLSLIVGFCLNLEINWSWKLTVLWYCLLQSVDSFIARR